jgi:NAD(P)H dehydrogenase (quinone)
MITITGATGNLGSLVIEDLLRRGVPADEITAVVRDPQKAAGLAAHGVAVRQADYSKPETLSAAFAGTDKLLLISSSEVGQRVEQHRNVVTAAVNAGVSLIAYTSVLRADTSGLALATEHKATENIISESGLRYVFLRNGWYLENYTENLAPALQHGAILGSAGSGRVAAASRADYAAAAAAVLTADIDANTIYELGGDQPFTITDLAAEVSRQSGTPVAYQDLPADEYAQALGAAGLPEAYAGILADSDLGLARGELHTESGELRELIQRPTTTLADAVTAALKG